MSNIDYKSVGLKVGLEIHVQLDTDRKLFCHCSTKLSESSSGFRFTRYLRPAKSEIGEVDPAAMLEWKKRKVYEYVSPEEYSCLVESDEEPPHPLDEESLLVAIALAKSLNMKIVDEVQVMRKIVIDGSNVSGFQRTSLIAFNGYITVEGRKIGIQTLCLEEDAARKIAEKEESIEYNIDRLGIPLVEIATAPDIDSPELAYKVALRIGQLAKLTGKTKRGLGSIRQDLNISIRGGAKIEIKGIQHLYLIPKVIEYEVMRQLRLLEIRDYLLERGVKLENIETNIYDVSKVFSNTSSKIIKRALSIENGGVYAALLPGFRGLLGKEIQPQRRFGTELSDYAKVWGGVGGIFHTDELPGYGITEHEVAKLYNELGGDPTADAILIVADVRQKAEAALLAALERARYAVIGIPEETRAANPDGTTRYMRPRPGAARMYPETDIPPVLITDDLIRKASKYLPEHPEAKLEKFMRKHGLSRELAELLINDIRLDLYEKLAEKYGGKVPYTVIASILVNTIPSLRREGLPVDDLRDDVIEEVVKYLADGVIAKEAVINLLTYVCKNPEMSIKQLVEKMGFGRITIDELDELITNIISNNKEKLLAKRDKAFPIVMSEVMKTVRGKIDGGIVAERVRNKLKDLLGI
ncbi:MAG: Glu-tRNA(Gln) amidotransferase subunit GatE [Desulfurococcaceae archaeon]